MFHSDQQGKSQMNDNGINVTAGDWILQLHLCSPDFQGAIVQKSGATERLANNFSEFVAAKKWAKINKDQECVYAIDYFISEFTAYSLIWSLCEPK